MRFETKTIIPLIIANLLLPHILFAETLSSPHYNIENPEFNAGGENSSSTNYRSQDAIGGSEDSLSTSSNYRLFPGFLPPAYPGVPGKPALANTGGNLYSALDFTLSTGGDPSDTNYAIAISTDNFVSDNSYIQANQSVGTSTVWQTYSAWGGASGERVYGLVANTTYTIKVKARYGPDSETGFSSTTQASTVNPTLTATVQGISSGTSIGSATTNIDTTSTSVPFSSLQTGSIKIGAQQITVTTNAVAGYTVTIQQDHDLLKTNGNTIPAVIATNANPAAWPAGITAARFGYHTTDTTLCTGTSGRFSADDTFAAASSTPYEVVCNSGPASSEATDVVFKVEVEALQAQGDYQNHITYVTTAQY